jgi:hypothetical protein
MIFRRLWYGLTAVILPVIIPRRTKRIYNLTIRFCYSPVRNVWRNNMNTAGSKQHLLITNHHFQLTGNNMRNLFVRMIVLRHYTSLSYVPKRKRSLTAMYKLSGEARYQFAGSDIFKKFHSIKILRLME